jgi:hypothetical protein
MRLAAMSLNRPVRFTYIWIFIIMNEWSAAARLIAQTYYYGNNINYLFQLRGLIDYI